MSKHISITINMPTGDKHSEKLGVLGDATESRASGKDSCSAARQVCRERNVGKVIMATMRAGPSSPCVLQLFPLVLHLKATSQTHICPSCCHISLRLSRLSLPLLPLPLTAIMDPPTKISRPSSPPSVHVSTHIHTTPRQAFTPYFTQPAWFSTSCHLPGTDSSPSDRLYQEGKKQTTSWGQGLGGLCGQDTDFIPSEMASVYVQGFR